MHAYLWFLMALSLFGGRRIDWLNMATRICVGCWQVEMETDKKETTKQRMLQGCPRRERSHPCDCVQQNTHIRYSSYLTKPYLIFILVRFALVLIQTIQFSISGTYCSSRHYIRKFLLSSPQLCYKSLKLSSPKRAALRSYLPLMLSSIGGVPGYPSFFKTIIQQNYWEANIYNTFYRFQRPEK